MIELYEGSVLASQAKIIAHQVNCRGVMGAGLISLFIIKQQNVSGYTFW